MSGKRKLDNDNSSLANRLHGLAIRLLRRLRGADSASAMSPARLSALSVLVYGGEMSVSELARREQVSRPTMSVTVQALQNGGLVRVRADSKDTRQRNVAATTRGRVVLNNARRRRVQRLAEAIASLPDARRRRLGAAMNDLETLLEELET